MGYKLIDYYNGKDIDNEEYKTRKEAEEAKIKYLRRKAKNKDIHNNLILIIKK